MNELETLLASGQITAFCLGNLGAAEAAHIQSLADQHADIREAIEQQLADLKQYAQGPALRPGLKNQVLDFMDQHRQVAPIDLNNPPLIDRYSDVQAWNTALRNLEPEWEAPGYALRVIKDTPEHSLSVVWLSDSMVESKHDADDFQESFFILEGACECDFEGEVVRFEAGDYFDIPPNRDHTIANISVGLNYVKGLVQRRKTA